MIRRELFLIKLEKVVTHPRKTKTKKKRSLEVCVKRSRTSDEQSESNRLSSGAILAQNLSTNHTQDHSKNDHPKTLNKCQNATKMDAQTHQKSISKLVAQTIMNVMICLICLEKATLGNCQSYSSNTQHFRD